jgi:AraC-like DNA-binding protein
MFITDRDVASNHVGPDGDSAALRFCSEHWPAPMRAAAINQFCTRLLRQQIEPLPGRAVALTGAIRCFDGLGIITASCAGLLTRRETAHATSHDVLVNIALAGERTLSQDGREITIRAGEALVTGSAETGVALIPNHNRYISLRVPAHALSVADLQFPPRVIPSDNDALRMLCSYVQLLDAPALAQPQLQRLAVAHVHELMTLMLCAPRAAHEFAGATGVRAARLQAIKHDIIRHLDTGDVSIGSLAARHRLTPRYIQMLFEADSTTLTEFVLAQRLERAHRRLRDPRWRHEKIAAVAFDCGFGDLSYFNRAFRARFDTTPSEVRAQGRREH